MAEEAGRDPQSSEILAGVGPPGDADSSARRVTRQS